MIGELVYAAAVEVAVPALRLAAPFSPRLRRGITGRLESGIAVREFAAQRDPSSPLLWLHAPSVGEALMAQAILGATRAAVPGLQSAFTWFSPSAERVARRIGADWSGWLPWDRRADMRAALDALRPTCIAFVRTEIWPVLVREAAARGIPSLMVNAVLASGSSRLGRVARTLLAPGYARLDAVGAVSGEDAGNFPLLGVDPARIHITGDARFDQVAARIEKIDRDRPLLRRFGSGARPWLVAGSTWPRDEDLLTGVLAARRAQLRAVVAPHEPDAEHIGRLENALTAAGLRHARLHADQDGEIVDPAIDVVVVDRVGVLADLYAVGDVAYVGGGFGSAGLHSVVEPAALGLPVLYGPRHGNAREAGRLARTGGGFIVDNGDELAARLGALLDDAEARRAAGAAAAEFVRSHTGGAEQSARLIARALRPD